MQNDYNSYNSGIEASFKPQIQKKVYINEKINNLFDYLDKVELQTEHKK